MAATKYIFVTGGVTSSLGKGIVSASLAKLLQARGYTVTIQKFDPYINIDPGTLNPYEHGECFVTNDGAETDLDLGHYERFLDVSTSQANNVTTGRIYQTVIDNERKGVYLGKTVQIVPHITDEIKRRMLLLGETQNYNIVITELGGTVGDIESLPYIEAVRQLKYELGDNNCVVIHLTLIPFLNAAKELKTKPTQHSVKELLSLGIQPDVLVCRTEQHLNKELKKKIALFCNVPANCVIEAMDASSIYDVPLLMLKEQLDKIILTKLRLSHKSEPDLERWKVFLGKLKNPTHEVTIGLVGKYTELPDAYKSISEAFIHAGASKECKINIEWIHAEYLSRENINGKLKNLDAVLVAPGFGNRGVEGKILTVEYARTHNIPFLGICLGMQCAVIEYARNVLDMPHANSTEIDPGTPFPVINMMESQKQQVNMGGTMRLGSYVCQIKKGTKAFQIYNQNILISERHRHRYEFNNDFLERFKQSDMQISGINPDTNLVEMIELKHHNWFVGVQFHPEYKSTVYNPHPLFIGFVEAALRFNTAKK